MTFDCDTRSNHFSAWSLAVSGDFVLRGELRFVSEQSDPEWVPGAHIALHGADRRIHFGAARYPSSPNETRIAVREGGVSETLGQVAFTREGLSFEVRSIGGSVVLKLGGFSSELELPVHEVALLCNTGNVMFEGVELVL